MPHVVHDDRCAALHVARGDRRAALDAGSYRTLLERLVLQRLAQERLAEERLAVSEPQHPTPLGW